MQQHSSTAAQQPAAIGQSGPPPRRHAPAPNPVRRGAVFPRDARTRFECRRVPHATSIPISSIPRTVPGSPSGIGCHPGAEELHVGAAQPAVRARLGVEGADDARHIDRGARPVDPRLFARQLAGVRDAAPRPAAGPPSRLTSGASALRRWRGRRARRGAGELAVGLVVEDRRARLQDHRPGVERRHHPHDRDAGLLVARRGSPPGSAPRRASAAAATREC